MSFVHPIATPLRSTRYGYLAPLITLPIEPFQSPFKILEVPWQLTLNVFVQIGKPTEYFSPLGELLVLGCVGATV